MRYRLAGGLFGILAAANEEVEWSYRVNVSLILVVVFLLSFVTYGSVVGALIVMLPSLVAQPLSEAVMYLIGIDFNINSLPVAAIGIGIGIDYGYYVLSPHRRGVRGRRATSTRPTGAPSRPPARR